MEYTSTSTERESKQGTGFCLRVVRRSGGEAQAVTVACDSVRLFARDGENGRGGGCLGIRRGHVPAIIALGNHPVVALLGGQTVFETPVSGGIAVVEAGGHTVTVYPD